MALPHKCSFLQQLHCYGKYKEIFGGYLDTFSSLFAAVNGKCKDDITWLGLSLPLNLSVRNIIIKMSFNSAKLTKPRCNTCCPIYVTWRYIFSFLMTENRMKSNISIRLLAYLRKLSIGSCKFNGREGYEVYISWYQVITALC